MNDKSVARILIVDDKESNLCLLRSTLEPMGYEVTTACSGMQALEYIFQNLPDLVVLDVLTSGMTSFEVVWQIRAHAACRGTPVLMLMAPGAIRDKVKGLDAGADDFMTKPFHPAELLARVRLLLRIKQLRDELQAKNSLLERILMRCISEDIACEIEPLRMKDYSELVRVYPGLSVKDSFELALLCMTESAWVM